MKKVLAVIIFIFVSSTITFAGDAESNYLKAIRTAENEYQKTVLAANTKLNETLKEVSDSTLGWNTSKPIEEYVDAAYHKLSESLSNTKDQTKRQIAWAAWHETVLAAVETLNLIYPTTNYYFRETLRMFNNAKKQVRVEWRTSINTAQAQLHATRQTAHENYLKSKPK